MEILSIRSIEILDSRGNPTLQTYVTLADGSIGTASVPSGASTGSHEAIELRDNDSRYFGKGVADAVAHVNGILGHELVGWDISNLQQIDKRLIDLDDTAQKSHYGANAILSISLACARAHAVHRRVPLWKALNEHYFAASQTRFPRLMVNVLNGGAHADWVIDIQECMICPKETVPSASIEIAANIFHTLQKLLEMDGHETSVGDEGGFAPELQSNDKAFAYIERAIAGAGYSREQVDIATDIAASEMYKDGTYTLHKSGKPDALSSADMYTYVQRLAQAYGIFSFEDPFAEDDWSQFKQMTKEMGDSHLIVGDDLYVTHPDRIQKGIAEKTSNAVLIKLNQVGTLWETVESIHLAQKAGWKVIISHRSGETTDSFISDLAVASGAHFIKAGSMSRSERLAKYNRLLEIEKIEI